MRMALAVRIFLFKKYNTLHHIYSGFYAFSMVSYLISRKIKPVSLLSVQAELVTSHRILAGALPLDPAKQKAWGKAWKYE